MLLFSFFTLKPVEEEASGTSVSEQLLMNTEQVGILLVSTINTTTNQTVRTISNTNLGMLLLSTSMMYIAGYIHMYILMYVI